MFERYTEDARRTLFFARYEASELGSLTIEPEHLLLGLIREAPFEDVFGESLEAARRAMEREVASRGRISTTVEIPFSPATKRILQFAAEEADALDHSYIGSEHLLLGLLRQEDPVAARYLHRTGVQLKAIREEAAKGRASDPLADITSKVWVVQGEPATRITFSPIGVVRSPFQGTAEIPKGLGAEHKAEGVLEVRPELEEGLADIEGFSHLFVIWCFHRVDRAELTARPPSDDRPHGVFATRSPQRPNPIGLTVVELLRRDGANLHVRGIDMLDGTPVLDIKPYLGGVPPERLRRGWLADAERRR
jgi:tRNA-Thr(GGU) m(6)t(6)A37 methyltransferase TsaA